MKFLQVNFSFKLRIYSTISQLLHEIILLEWIRKIVTRKLYFFCSLKPPQRHSFFYWLIHLERLNSRKIILYRNLIALFSSFYLRWSVHTFTQEYFSVHHDRAQFIVVYVIKKRVMRLIVCEDQIVIVYDSFWDIYIRINVWRVVYNWSS